MALLEVLKYPDARLRKKGEPVATVTPELKAFSEDMLETMYHSRGIGLASVQVNRHIRLIVIDVRPKKGGRYVIEDMSELEQKVPMPLILFNPEVFQKEGKTTYDEGCLSVPTYYETVERAEHIWVRGLDQNGQPVEFETDGLLAICIQHEIDHLDGKLFIDRLTPIRSNRIKAKIKKNGYPDPKPDTHEEEDDQNRDSTEKDEHSL